MNSVSIQQLSETVERLVVFGGVVATQPTADWMERCGIVQRVVGADEWLAPTFSFLSASLPARDQHDLVRRSVVRDPRYRLHLDMILARVVQVIAKGERWSRFEDLLFGSLEPLSQRLLALIEWASRHFNCTPAEIEEGQWVQFEDVLFGEQLAVFRAWDASLWGEARGAADLFPLLEQLYVPLCHLPVCLIPSRESAGLLADLVQSAKSGDGVVLKSSDQPLIEAIQAAGAPVLFSSDPPLCVLAGRVEVILPGQVQEELPYRSASLGVNRDSTESRSIIGSDEIAWLQTGNDARCAIPFISLPPGLDAWPEGFGDQSPAWTRLPGRAAICATDRLKKSLEYDEALIQLDQHALYGLILQLFVAEALDRELSTETILLAPSLEKVGMDAIAGTSVLYRPSGNQDRDLGGFSGGFLNLGDWEYVMGHVARSFGLHPLPLPFLKSQCGLWSWAFYMMIDLGLVIGQSDRWALSSELHDRMYTGALMTKVLRGRRSMREEIHSALNRLWRDAHSLAKPAAKEEVAA
jgi:hypothetical protein